MKALVLPLTAISLLGLAMASQADEGSERTSASHDRTYDLKRRDNLAQIERQRVAALVNAHMKTANRLHAADFQLINPLGGALTKEEYLGGIASGVLDYLVWQPGEITVRRNGKTAVLRYRSQLQIVIAGETQPLGSFWHTDYYENRRGQWQVVWSHATAIPE